MSEKRLCASLETPQGFLCPGDRVYWDDGRRPDHWPPVVNTLERLAGDTAYIGYGKPGAHGHAVYPVGALDVRRSMLVRP